jgi:hypothetical protein
VTWPSTISTSPSSGSSARRAGDVERALDGARRPALDPGRPLLGVDAQVDEVLDAQPRHEQPELVGLAGLGQVAHRGPELARGDVEVLDDPAGILDDAAHDLLDAGVAGLGREARDLVEQGLRLGGISDLGHQRFLSSAWLKRGQPRSPPATGSVTPVT